MKKGRAFDAITSARASYVVRPSPNLPNSDLWRPSVLGVGRLDRLLDNFELSRYMRRVATGILFCTPKVRLPEIWRSKIGDQIEILETFEAIWCAPCWSGFPSSVPIFFILTFLRKTVNISTADIFWLDPLYASWRLGSLINPPDTNFVVAGTYRSKLVNQIRIPLYFGPARGVQSNGRWDSPHTPANMSFVGGSTRKLLTYGLRVALLQSR